MKIGIITLTGYFNYGNRLQNYATQKVFKSLGGEVETIEIYKTDGLKTKIKKFIHTLMIKIFKLKIIKKLNNEQFEKANLSTLKDEIDEIRTNRIHSWSKKYIKNSNYIIKNNIVPKSITQDFNYFSTGSDQVWNPYFIKYPEIYFLSFANPEQRVSFSASFGISDITEEYRNDYQGYIDDMKSLSVREHAGQKIIKDLTGRDAEVLIDPTMMLDKNEWLQVASKPKCMPNKKYLLTYVLGNQTEQFKAFVNQLAKEKGLEVLNLLNPYDKDIHCVDPGEFVYLINHADVMITDSFHGAVFSILMKTPFVIFERQDACVSMNSRIDTLVRTFKMESRLSSNINSVDDVYNIDFTYINEILTVEREKAISYLKNAFSME